MSGTLDPTIAPSAPPPPTYAPPDQSQPQAPTPSQPQQGQPPAQQFFGGDNGWRNLMLMGGAMSQAQNARDSRGLPMNPGMAAFSVGLATALGDQSTMDSRNASTQKTMTETAEQQFKNRALEMQLPFVTQRAQADLDATKAGTAKTGVETQGLQANLPFIAPKAQADIDASKATTLKQQMENQLTGSTLGGQIQLQNARNATRLRAMTDDQATRGGQTRPDGTPIVYPRLAPSMDLTGSDDVNDMRYQIKDEDQRMALIKNGIEYAGQTGIMNPYQIYSLISQESRWMPRVVADEYTTDANGKRIPTNSTATGLGQVTLSTAKPYLDALGIKPEDQQAYLKDPQNNLNIAMSVLRDKAKAAGVTTADDWSSWENAAAAFGNYHGGTDAYGITNHAYTSQIGHDILVRQELAKKRAGAGGASNQPAAPAVQTGQAEPVAQPGSIMAQRQAAAQQQQPTDDHVNPPPNPNLFAGPGVPPAAPEPVAQPGSIVAQRQQMAQAATTPPAATPAPPRWSPTNMGGPASDPAQTPSTPPPAAPGAAAAQAGNTGDPGDVRLPLPPGFVTGEQALVNAEREMRQANIWAGQPEAQAHLTAAQQWREYATALFKQAAAPATLRGEGSAVITPERAIQSDKVSEVLGPDSRMYQIRQRLLDNGHPAPNPPDIQKNFPWAPPGTTAVTPHGLSPGEDVGMKDSAGDAFGPEARDSYKGALSSNMAMQNIQQQLDVINAKGPAFWNSGGGAAAQLKLEMARGINAALSVVGKEPLFDEKKIASYEDMIKQTKTAGFQLARSLGSHEAASVVTQAMSSVPSIENSPQGAQKVLDAIKGANQLIIDQHAFMSNWALNPEFGGHHNPNDMRGADVAFSQAYPPEKYAKRALSLTEPIKVTGNPTEAMKNYLPGTRVILPDGTPGTVPGDQFIRFQPAVPK